MAGKFLPMVPSFPHSSIDAAVSDYPGDLIVLGLFIMLPKVLRQVNVNIPRRGQKITDQLYKVGYAGGSVYLTSVLDTVFAVLLRKFSVSIDLKRVFFLVAWWIPSRYGLVNYIFKETYSLVKPKEVQRTYLKRIATVGAIFGTIYITSNMLQLAVSRAFVWILPAFAVLLS